MRLYVAVLSVVTFLSACATPHVVERKKLSDDRLNCQQLKQQVAEADAFRRKAEAEKGVTGTNVAAALLFWPGMAATYSNANEAIRAAEARKDYLTDLYHEKGCK